MREIKVNKNKTMTKYRFLMFLNKNNMKISLISILTANVSPFILSIIFKGGSIPIYIMLPYFIFLITAIFTSKIMEGVVDNFLRDENYKIMTFEEFNYKCKQKENNRKNIKWLIWNI